MFTGKDHFSNNILRWERHVKPFFDKEPHKKVNILMISGVHDGRAPHWLLENTNISKRGNRSKVYCVDFFKKDVLTRFKKNLDHFGGDIVEEIAVKKCLKESIEKIKMIEFDFIFIDSMGTQELLEMLVLTFPLLKKQGLLIVDDYTNGIEHQFNCPRPAIDAFMNIYAHLIKVRELSWQAIMIKRSKALGIKKCKSEYYHENMELI